MNLAELTATFNRLAKSLERSKWGMHTLSTAGLSVQTESIDDPDALWRALRDAAPRAGWLQWQSHQADFENGLPEPEAGWGAVLAAEAVVNDTESLRVDFMEGRWHLTRYRHDRGGEEYLCDEVVHLLHGSRNRGLRYRRYWKIDPGQGAVQCSAVLAAVTDEQGGPQDA